MDDEYFCLAGFDLAVLPLAANALGFLLAHLNPGTVDRQIGQRRLQAVRFDRLAIEPPELLDRRADALQQPLGDAVFEVLLLGAVPCPDEFRRLRQQGGTARGDDTRAVHGVEVLDLAVRQHASGATLASDANRSEVFGAVQSDPNMHGFEAAPEVK